MASQNSAVHIKVLGRFGHFQQWVCVCICTCVFNLSNTLPSFHYYKYKSWLCFQDSFKIWKKKKNPQQPVTPASGPYSSYCLSRSRGFLSVLLSSLALFSKEWCWRPWLSRVNTCSVSRPFYRSCLYRHTLFYCASQILHFFFFYIFKVCGNPMSIMSIGIFPTASAHFMPWCHILVILAIFLDLSL